MEGKPGCNDSTEKPKTSINTLDADYEHSGQI